VIACRAEAQRRRVIVLLIESLSPASRILNPQITWMKTDLFSARSISTLAKQRVIFRVMTDPNPNDQIAFAVGDGPVMDSDARRIKRRMPF
jgi:hypothetical protein